MDLVVPPHGRLNGEEIVHAVTNTGSVECLIDLDAATFVEPAGLVAIAAAAERARLEGRPVLLREPRNSSCRNYLSRMRVGDVLTELGVPHHLPPVRTHALGDRLQELRRFTDEAHLEEVANAIVSLFQRAGLHVVQPLYQALFELGLNAVQHSGRGGGFVALQAFPRLKDVAFAVADSGRGLRASLAEVMSVPSDAAAIKLAAQKHITATSEPGRGRGITGVIRLTDRYQGAVVMLSGTARGVFDHGHWDPQVSHLSAPFLGTLAQTRLAYERMLE